MADPKNPRNTAAPLYKMLTRLFSGPIVQYDQEQQKRYKRYQLDKYSTKFSSLSGKQFKKSSYNIYDNYTAQYYSAQNQNREIHGF